MKNEQISLKKIKKFKPKYTKESEISKIEKHELYKIGVDLIEQNKGNHLSYISGSSLDVRRFIIQIQQQDQISLSHSLIQESYDNGSNLQETKEELQKETRSSDHNQL